MGGEVVAIVVPVVLGLLFVGLLVNQREVRALRTRRDELDDRTSGLETRLTQFAQAEAPGAGRGPSQPSGLPGPVPPPGVPGGRSPRR